MVASAPVGPGAAPGAAAAPISYMPPAQPAQQPIQTFPLPAAGVASDEELAAPI